MKLKILYAALLEWYGWKSCCEDGNRYNFRIKFFCMDPTGAPLWGVEVLVWLVARKN